MYIFFPIGWMYYFGTNLDQRFAVPDFWPKKEETHTIPFEREDISAELQRLKQKRLESREKRRAWERENAVVNGEEVQDEGRFGGVMGEQAKGPSPYLRSLENATRDTKKAPVPEEQEGSGKGWFKLW